MWRRWSNDYARFVTNGDHNCCNILDTTNDNWEYLIEGFYDDIVANYPPVEERDYYFTCQQLFGAGFGDEIV